MNGQLTSSHCWMAVLVCLVGTGCQSTAGGGGGGGGGGGSGAPSEGDLCADAVCEQGEECDPQTGQCEPDDDDAQPAGGAGGEGEGEDDGSIDHGSNGGGEVLEEASSRARQLDPGAIVIVAGGLNSEGSDGAGTHTVEYEFIAVNPDAPQTTYFISFDRTEWSVEQVDSVLVGVVYADLLDVKMTEAQARARLTEEGLSDDFRSWSLRVPPPPPFSANPQYTFIYSDDMATVDAETGAVSGGGS